MKIFETVTPLGDPLNNFQSQFESHVRTEEFKHIKLVLTNALAKVYTRRLKAFNVRACGLPRQRLVSSKIVSNESQTTNNDQSLG